MAEHVESYDAIIVGAGFSGLGQLHGLRERGLRCRVIEAGDDLGGTWYWNRYPGARVDVESAWYSYGFSEELQQEWEWSEKLPTQPEILRYLEHVAERFDLRRDISFGTRVLAAAWEEQSERWRVTTDQGDELEARFLVMATGNLSAVKDLEVPGNDTFGGEVLHTARWPHDPVDFTGRRVGVVGTGSSGIQVIPVVAEQAAHLTVFQRTPAFALPARNRPLDPDAVRAVKAEYGEWRRRQRDTYLGIPDPAPTQSALEVTAVERRARYEAGWEHGGLNALLTAYNDLFLSEEANETLAEFLREKIRSIVDDPAVAEDLSPRTYPVGAKRACLQTGYYETFNRDDVTLVNLRRTPLVEMTEHGLRTTDAEHELDVIILATGFDAVTGSIAAVDVRGREGRKLTDVWSEGPVSYLGLAVAGFPNLFLVTGPGSPSLISNMAYSIQQHTSWIADTIGHLAATGTTTFEATQQAQDAWMAQVQEIAAMTLFPKADTYYNGANVPGKPRAFAIYVGGVAGYADELERITSHGYAGFALDGVERHTIGVPAEAGSAD